MAKTRKVAKRKQLTKRQNTKPLIIKTRGKSQYKLNITLLDFVPPIFVKIYEWLRGYVNKNYVQISYIDLGMAVVFIGTMLAFALIYFVVPYKIADATMAFYLYKHGNYNVTEYAITKANIAKSLLKTYEGGVILGVQDKDVYNYENVYDHGNVDTLHKGQLQDNGQDVYKHFMNQNNAVQNTHNDFYLASNDFINTSASDIDVDLSLDAELYYSYSWRDN